MLASILALLAATPAGAVVTPAAAATPGASLPTPIPVGTLAPAPIVFHMAAIADNYPWLGTLVQVLFLVSTVALIALMSVQTTKTEGLSGTIGGRAEAAYHGRLGLDQQITRVTTVAAYAWFILAFAFFWITR